MTVTGTTIELVLQQPVASLTNHWWEATTHACYFTETGRAEPIASENTDLAAAGDLAWTKFTNGVDGAVIGVDMTGFGSRCQWSGPMAVDSLGINTGLLKISVKDMGSYVIMQA